MYSDYHNRTIILELIILQRFIINFKPLSFSNRTNEEKIQWLLLIIHNANFIDSKLKIKYIIISVDTVFRNDRYEIIYDYLYSNQYPSTFIPYIRRIIINYNHNRVVPRLYIIYNITTSFDSGTMNNSWQYNRNLKINTNGMYPNKISSAPSRSFLKLRSN